MAGRHRERAHVVGHAGTDRRREIGQGKVWPPIGLGHLLAQGVPAGQLGPPLVVGPQHDVVAIGVGRPEANDCVRAE